MTEEHRPDTKPQRCDPEKSAFLSRLQKTHPFPLTAVITVTERCNLRCGHCYVPQPQLRDELSLDEITAVLDELAAMGVLFLIITGGEPTLRQDLVQIVDRAVDRRFSVRIKTNATLLDEAQIDALVEAGVSEIHTALYDDRSIEHDAFVGLEGAWDRTIAATRRFSEKGVRVRAGAVVMSANAARISKLVTLFEHGGYSYTIDTAISPRSDGDNSPCTLRPSVEQLESILEDQRLFDPDNDGGTTPRFPGDALCIAGSGSVHIGPSGVVTLCPFLPLTMGNVREKPLQEIWLESEQRRRFVELKWSELPECASCELAWTCTRCPGSALLETGDVTGISPGDCAAARASANVFNRLRDKRETANRRTDQVTDEKP